MSRRRRQGLSPSLFPFLAVLVCTLGTLILLLALVAQNAATAAANESEQARNSVKEQPAAPRLTAANVRSLIEEAEFRVEQLIAFRDQQVADIEDRRDQITHLDDHMGRLREELKRLNEEVQIVTGRQQVSIIDQQQLADLKSQIEVESQRVAAHRERLQNQTPRVVIVPHKGPNGTDRRPVYLECTSKGLTIWPEGVQLPETYLQESIADANPLDAALRVIRHHAMQNYGDTVAPYPLLVIRPDGIQTYNAARRAMRDWDDQFGYELVPAHVELAYDTADPALKKKVDHAIRQAIIKQNGMQRLADRISGIGGSGTTATRSRRYPTLSAASMDRQGRASGFRDHRDGYSSGNPFAPSGNSGQYGDLGAGTGADAVNKLDQHLRDARDNLTPGQVSGGPLGSGYAGDPTEQDSFAGNLASDSIGRPSAIRSVDPMRGNSSARPDSGDTEESQTANQYASVPNGDDQRNDTAGTDSTNSFNPDDNSRLRKTGDVNAQTNPYLTESSDQQNSPSNSSTSGDDRIGSSNPSQQASTPGSSSSAPTRGATAGMTMPENSTLPSSNMTEPPPSPSNSRELVRRQGTNWALPKSVANSHGNSIVRTIRVLCYPDRFVLLPQHGEGRIEMFGLSDGDINRATLELATAVRDRINRWGAALPGGRWQPRLDVEIMSHGESRFHQLRTLMSGSGVEVEGRPGK